jgi:hypothetical protein
LQIKCIKIYEYINPISNIEIKGTNDTKEYKRYKLLQNLDSNLDTDLVIVKENKLSLVINTSNTQESSINLIKSNVRFIAITMIYNGERYKIVLKTPEYNFYVVGNRIDKNFLQYYLTNILFIPLSNGVSNEHKFEYFLEIMDNDVNFVFLNEQQYILLALDKYTLF